MSVFRKIKRCFYWSVYLLTVMSLAILFMPWAADQSSQLAVRIVGIAFWVSVIGGYGSIAMANKWRKRFCQAHHGKDIYKKYKPGILGFFSNRVAEMMDIMLGVFLVAFLIALVTPLRKTDYLLSILALLIWAANMHSLFNGRVYRAIKIKKRRNEL